MRQTKEKLAITEQKLQELQGEINLLRGKTLESMDKEALAKRKADLEDIQREAQQRVDDAILRREVEEEMPEGHSCVCPINQSVMNDPVMASDGHTYERDAIQKHIRLKLAEGADANSPLTGELLAHHNVTTNHTHKKSIEEEIERRIKEKRRQEKEYKAQQGGSSSGKRKR